MGLLYLITRLNGTGRIKEMAGRIKVNQVFSTNPHASPLRGRPKTDGVTTYKETLTNAKLKTRNRGKKTEPTGRSPLAFKA
jgi:hypothetical protein